MPCNTGKQPAADLVDIRYRNGEVDRGIAPAKRRWTLNDPAFPNNYAFDILEWQRA